MRRIGRLELSADITAVLAERTRRIERKRLFERRVEEAMRLWDSRVQAIERVAELLRDQMAPGPGRCMYCEGGEGDQIDHFWPRAAYPERTYVWANLLWSCGPCNRRKSTYFPLDAAGTPMLLDPTNARDRPREHLRLAPRTGFYESLSDRGCASERAYDLNRPLLQRDRSRVFASLQNHVEKYDEFMARGEAVRAAEVKALILAEPHASVLVDLIEVADSPAADLLLRESCRAAIARRPEIRGWCEGW